MRVTLHYRRSTLGPMPEIVELLWDDHNIAHIGKHQVAPVEVEEVVFGATTVFFDAGRPERPGRLVALGETDAGRLLAVYLDTPAAGRSYPVSARSMTAKEQRVYRREREADDG